MFTDDVRLKLVNKTYEVENIHFNSQPVIVHGNGLSKLTLNSYTNYIPNKWSPESGCTTCYDNTLDLSVLRVFLKVYNVFNTVFNLCFYILQEENYPIVLISVFVDRPTPFFNEFLEKIENIDYPKSRIFLSITTLVNISFFLNN